MLTLFEHILDPLLGMSLTAAFVAVVVILLRVILKKQAPKQVICLLWLLVFARLLIPVMVESPISLVPSALEDVVPGQVEQMEEPAQTVESPDPGQAGSAPVNSPAVPGTYIPNTSASPAAPAVSQPVAGTTQAPVVTPPAAEDPPVLEVPSEPETPVVGEPAAPVWMYVLPAVWLAGVAVMLVVGVVSYGKLRRRVYDAIRTEDGVWEHPSLSSPFILGLIRPKIYLPMGIEGQPRQFILHHERAHLRRLDHVVKPICWLALAIHWFNPLAWVAFLLMSRDIETACDESVIRRLGDGVKADYSATLLALATDKRFPAPSPLSFGEGDAKVRIKNVLNFKKPALWVTIAAVVVAVIAAVCLLTDPVTSDENWAMPQWAEELAAENVESMTVSFLRSGGQEITTPVPQETQKTLIAVINAIPKTDFRLSLDSMGCDLTVEEWLKWAEFGESIPENGTVRISIRRSDSEHHGVLTYQEGQVYLSVLVEHSELDGDPFLSSVRWEVENAALAEFLSDAMTPELCGYTTKEEYPGLYFLEEPSSTVGTKITAYKLVDGQLVLVGGYEEHMANNFDVLIHADGEAEAIWSGQDAYAMFEELLAAACREMDPNWTPPGGEGSDSPDPNGSEALTSELEEMLKQAYVRLALADVSGSPTADDVWIENYYGQYGDAHAMIIHDSYHPYNDAAWTERVDGVEFSHQDSRRIRVYDGTGFYTLTEAFDKGLLTHADLEQIAQLHRERREEQTQQRKTEYFKHILLDSDDGWYSWYNAAMGSLFDSPEEMDLDLVFYGGFSDMQGPFTEEEADYLASRGFTGPYHGQKRPADRLNEVLEKYFGVSLSDVQIPDAWVYYEATDSYYSDHTDAYLVHNFTVTRVEEAEDNVFHIYYSVEPYYGALDPATGEYVTNGVITLQQVDDGGYMVLSNRNADTLAPDTPIPEDPTPISALGELFLSALNDEVEIVDPGLGKTDTLSALLKATTPTVELSITEITAVDLDGDGTEEMLLTLDTGTITYGTMILHCNDLDGRIYSYTLWARAFSYLKTDGTFYFSNSSAEGGISRISFNQDGYITENILFREYDYANDTLRYYINGQQTTENAYNEAWEAHKAKPDAAGIEYTPENAEAFLKEHFAGSGASSGLGFLGSLPFDLVTPDTLPADPEEYYLVAELPESYVYLYARNHGGDSMLYWDGNFWWPLEGRTAHTPHMNLPQMFLLEETSAATTVAVVSQTGTGTGVNIHELAAYVMGENKVDSSFYFGMRDYVYDWRPVAEDFNRNNTLIYDAQTNSLTLLWNGTAYCSGTLREDLGLYQGLEDGFTGALVVNQDIVCFEHNGGSSFTITVEPCIAKGGQGHFVEEGWWQSDNEDNRCYPMSVGATGFTLTWTVEFTGGGFEASAPTIAVTNKEQTFLKAAFPEEGIYLFALGNGGEYYYLFEGGQLHKVPGSGFLTDLDVNCRLVDLDGDGRMELAAVGNHYSGSSSASILSVFDKGADGWEHYRLPSYYSSNTTDYVSPFGGSDLMNDAASFTIGSDPTQVTMHLGGFDLLFTVSDEVASRSGDYYVWDGSRSITWEGDGYYLRLMGSVHRHGGQYGWPSDDCGVTFQFVCRLEYSADGTFAQVPVGIIPQYPNFTLLDTITEQNAALYFGAEHRPLLVEGSRSGWLPYDEEEILFRCEKGTLMETQLSDGTPGYLVELRDGSGEVHAALYVVWSEAENAWVYPEEKRPYLSVNSSSLWQRLSAGSGDFYAIRSSDLTVVMWGSPDYGYYFDIPMEAPVEFISGAVALSSGPTGTTMAIDTAGTLWGLGTQVDSVTLEPRQLLDSVAVVSCGQYDSYVVRCDGSLWSYGHNETALPTLKTMEFNGVTWYKLMDNVIAVQAGGYGSGYAILSDHTLWVWNGPQRQFRKIADNVAFCSDGRIIDLNGNLVDGNGNVLLTEVKYANYHYAIKTDGTLWALTSPDPDTLWGVGTLLDEPVFITDGVAEMASGEFESILLKTDGSLWKLKDGILTDISFAQ